MVKRLAWIYFGATVGFAVLAALPLSALLYADLGHSLYTPHFDYLLELYNKTEGWPLAALAPAAVLAGAGFALLGVFLSGGALAAILGRAGDMPGFFAGGGRHFWRLLRLLLLAAVLGALVLGAGAAAGHLGRRIWGEGLEERPLAIFTWFRWAIVMLLCLGVGMVFDYARIRLVFEDRRSAVRSLLGALGFVAAHPGRTTALYALLWAAAIAVAVVYLALSAVLPRSGLGWLALVFLLQQAFVWARCAIKLLFLTKQAGLYTALEPAPPPSAPELEA
jgi:hypothetical protein